MQYIDTWDSQLPYPKALKVWLNSTEPERSSLMTLQEIICGGIRDADLIDRVFGGIGTEPLYLRPEIAQQIEEFLGKLKYKFGFRDVFFFLTDLIIEKERRDRES